MQALGSHFYRTFAALWCLPLHTCRILQLLSGVLNILFGKLAPGDWLGGCSGKKRGRTSAKILALLESNRKHAHAAARFAGEATASAAVNYGCVTIRKNKALVTTKSRHSLTWSAVSDNGRVDAQSNCE